MLADFRFAWRRLTSRPGFFAVAVLPLGLGIGATTVFFGLMNSTLLKPLPIERPHEVFSFINPRHAAPVQSYPNYLDFKARSQTMDLSVYRFVRVSASFGKGSNQRLWGYTVAGDYFSLLGVDAALGRTIAPEDDVKRGGHPVVMLSHAAWQRHFAGRADAIGRRFRINGLEYTLIGVTPPGFTGTERFFLPDIFVPTAMTSQIEIGATYLDSRDSENTFMIARVRPGISRARAETEANAIAKQIGQEHPKSSEGLTVKLVEPGWAGDFLRGNVVTFSAVLMAVAGLLLLVVCVNLAGLLLADAAERRKETAIRLAVGASRGHLIRQLLAESLLLSLAGGLLGVILTTWGVDAISHMTPPVDFAINTQVPIDYRVLLFAAGLTFVTGIVLGLMPAWQSTRTDLQLVIKNDAADARTRRWPLRDVLVGVQVALSVVLLAASGLMLRSLSHATEIPLGFQANGVAVVGLDPELQGYDPAKQALFQRTLLDRLRALPGVQAAGFANALPLDLEFSFTNTYEAGTPEPPLSRMPQATTYIVSPDFFRTMGTRLVAGREYEYNDTTGERDPVVLVNEAFVKKVLLTTHDPQAATLRSLHIGTSKKPRRIVGVVETGKYLNLGERDRPVVFFPYSAKSADSMRVVARTAGDARQLLGRMRQVVQSLDAEIPIYRAETLEEHLNLPLLPSRLAATAFASFGAITMLLAAIGLYGVMAFAVARRTREIGIRMAIGARPAQVARLVLNRTVWLVGLGAAAGLGLAVLAGGLLEPLLVGVPGRDPSALLAGVAVMGLVAFLASWIPARRAMRMDPARALRTE